MFDDVLLNKQTGKNSHKFQIYLRNQCSSNPSYYFATLTEITVTGDMFISFNTDLENIHPSILH